MAFSPLSQPNHIIEAGSDEARDRSETRQIDAAARGISLGELLRCIAVDHRWKRLQGAENVVEVAFR